MKNYKDSDYAINKSSNGIVYRFADQTVEITSVEYLQANPDKTEQDFHKLKELSDAIFFEQDRSENAQNKRNVSIHSLEERRDFSTQPLDEEYIEIQSRKYALDAVLRLFESGTLTDVQKRRFILFIFKGLSLRRIAAREGVSFHAIAQSINAVSDKLKKLFEKF